MNLKLGIIGTNFITERFVDAARKEGAEIVSVYSRADKTGAEYSERMGIPKHYDDFEKFLSDEDINAVYIASPNYAHAGQSISAMEHGKHVICEKPAASNIRELTDVLEVAKQTKCVYLEAMRPQFDPAVEVIRNNLYKLGAIRHAVFDFSQYSSRYDRFKQGIMTNAFDPTLSNASVMDIGVYCIHFCHMLFGKPLDITSEATFLDNGFEGAGVSLFKYDGFSAVIQYSKIADSAVPCYIQGENGTLMFDKVSMPHNIRIKYRNGDIEELSAPFPDNNMIYEVREFDRMILGKAFTHEHTQMSVLEMEALDKIRANVGIVFPADKREE